MLTAMPKNFEQLREFLWEERLSILETLNERLEELTAFQQGRYNGEIMAYDEILGILRNVLKYGDVE